MAKYRQVHEDLIVSHTLISQQTVAAAEGGHSAHSDGDESGYANLPAALRAFKTLADHPRVMALKSGHRRISCQKAVTDDPADETAVAELSKYIHELEEASRIAIEDYVQEPGLFKRAFEALEAGNSTFLEVYAAVWNLITVAEPESVITYKKRVADAVAKLPKGKKQPQRAKTAVKLFQDGANVRPKFAVVVEETLYQKLQAKRSKAIAGSKFSVCKTLKDAIRLCEKIAFCGDATSISDMVRAMIVVQSMAGVDAVLEMLLELEADGVIVIVRLKDRFFASPSSGGWRDLMVNFFLAEDKAQHICELQIVHDKMLTAREGLSGHAIYDRVRTAIALLNKKCGGTGPARDALSLAAFITAMGGGAEIERGHGRSSHASNTSSDFDLHKDRRVDHEDARGIFLSDKGWLSDAPLSQWEGVTVNSATKRVVKLQLPKRGLVGKLPLSFADLDHLEVLDLIGNDGIVKPEGVRELKLLDSHGLEIHFTTKEPTQKFLDHLRLPLSAQLAAVANQRLVAAHGLDGPALRHFFDANRGNLWMNNQKWFAPGQTDVATWHGIETTADGRVSELTLGHTGIQWMEGAGLDNLPELRILNLLDRENKYSSIMKIPVQVASLSNLNVLDVTDCRYLQQTPDLSGLVAAGLEIRGCTTVPHLHSWKTGGFKALDVSNEDRFKTVFESGMWIHWKGSVWKRRYLYLRGDGSLQVFASRPANPIEKESPGNAFWTRTSDEIDVNGKTIHGASATFVVSEVPKQVGPGKSAPNVWGVQVSWTAKTKYETTSTDRVFFFASESLRSRWMISIESSIKPFKDQTLGSSYTLADFEMVKVLSKGSFGKVMLSKTKATGEYVALKVLKMEMIAASDETTHMETQNAVLQNANHPFLTGMLGSFQTEELLVFVMEYVNGGELFFYLSRDRTFSEVRTKFYTAQITLAITYLHARGIIYRDLKLESLMLDKRGNIKITGFSLMKEDVNHGDATTTFCGTPEYLAPEQLGGDYGRSVDWWSVGVVMYEMICGHLPFYNRDHEELFDLILHEDIKLPSTLSPSSRDLLSKLIVKDPAGRLGSSEADGNDIMAHDFFSDIDFEKLYNLEIKAPFVPKSKSETDVANIEKEFTDEKAQTIPPDTDAVLATVQKENPIFDEEEEGPRARTSPSSTTAAAAAARAAAAAAAAPEFGFPNEN